MNVRWFDGKSKRREGDLPLAASPATPTDHRIARELVAIIDRQSRGLSRRERPKNVGTRGKSTKRT
jgi:hypothetical protein